MNNNLPLMHEAIGCSVAVINPCDEFCPDGLMSPGLALSFRLHIDFRYALSVSTMINSSVY